LRDEDLLSDLADDELFDLAVADLTIEALPDCRDDGLTALREGADCLV